MNTASNTNPAPNSDPNPQVNVNLNLVPNDAPKPKTKSFLNQRDQRELEKRLQVCMAAQNTAFAPKLLKSGITAEFVTTLLTDITNAKSCASLAVAYTKRKEGATLSEHDAIEVLMNDIRTVQAAVRQAYAQSNPAKLGEYFIGERVDQNLATLDTAAQGILNRMNEARPPGIDTDFIVAFGSKAALIGTKQNAQEGEQQHATTERGLRDALLESIKWRVYQIQFAADAQFPPKVSGNPGIRVQFGLPARRPFAPRLPQGQ